RPPGYTTVIYNDPYSDMFWWWLLSQSLDYRANWAYHHRYTMDQLRYNEMLARDAALSARIRELELANARRDPLYTPPGVDYDLMYTDDYVAAAVNPTLEGPPPPPRTTSSGLFRACCVGFLVIGILLAIFWFIFVKRWNA